MSDQEFQIATVGICLRKIKEFLEATTDTTKMEEAKIAHEHLELLFNIGSDYVTTKGCGRSVRFD